jgi:regulatory protein
MKKTLAHEDRLLLKARHYCSYQERSHYEVREKLYSLGMHKPQVEAMLAQLITQGYLDEERFATSFARGKFRLKQWGRIKIKSALKLKRVSEYNIKFALRQIDENEYLTTLNTLVARKWATLDGESGLQRRAKTISYLLQKGFEPAFVQQAVKNLC